MDVAKSYNSYAAVHVFTDEAVEMALEVGVNIAFGTDLLVDKELGAKQGKFLAKLGNWHTGYEAIRWRT